ncbi:fimbrillin family protein [Bacteroides sp.]
MKKLIRKIQLELTSLSPLPIGEGLGKRLLFFMALFLCSCSQSDALLPDVETNALQLSSVSLVDDGQTRASVSDNEVTKVSLYTTTTANAAYTAQSLSTYTKSGGTWNVSGTAPLIEEAVKVYAFYPVGSSVTNNTSGNHTVPVQVKLTDTFAGEQADYLYSGSVASTAAIHSVSVVLKHALCKVSFKVRKSTTADKETLTLQKIEIMSPTNRLQVGDGVMNLSTGVLNALVTTSSVALTGSVGLQTEQAQPNVSCLLAPMNGQESVLSFRLTVKVSGETSSRTFITKVMNPVQWAAGKHYVYAINVDKMSATLTGLLVDKWKTDANQTTSIGI